MTIDNRVVTPLVSLISQPIREEEMSRSFSRLSPAEKCLTSGGTGIIASPLANSYSAATLVRLVRRPAQHALGNHWKGAPQGVAIGLTVGQFILLADTANRNLLQ